MEAKCDLCKKCKATKEYISCGRRGIKVFLYCEKCYKEIKCCRGDSKVKVRSLVDKFTLKEKRKYIVKGRIYDVLHEEERGYAVNDEDGEDVILRHSECEVVEYDNPEEVGIKIGEQFLIDNSMYIEVIDIEEDYVDYKKSISRWEV